MARILVCGTKDEGSNPSTLHFFYIYFNKFMNIFIDFIRFNYIYSFSFKNFSSKSNSLKKPKPLSLYLASDGRNSEISIRSIIKHEFKLSEFQRSGVSSFSIIPSRKDDEFGRPYFKPIVFKYNFYWVNYTRKHIFFINMFLSNFSCNPNLTFLPSISSGLFSIINFNFFFKRNFFKKRRFYKFKRKKFKRFLRFPYFNFRSNGIFFSYLPISNRFSFKKSIYSYKSYLKCLKSNFIRQRTCTTHTNFAKSHIFTSKQLSKFFLSNKYFNVNYPKRFFEISKFLSTTFFFGRLNGRYFKNKFYRFSDSHFKIKRWYFKRNSVFRKFYKFKNNINAIFSKLKLINNINIFSSVQSGFFSVKKNFFSFVKNFFFKFFYSKIIKVSKFYPQRQSFSIFCKNVINNFSKFFIKFKFKKFKRFFLFFRYFTRFFKFRSIKFSKFFLSIFFFQLFYKFHLKRSNNFSILNVFKIFFNKLLILNNFFFTGNIFNNSFKSTFIFSYFFSLFFKKNFFIDPKCTNFNTKFFYNSKINFFGTKSNFFLFSDFYNSFYNDYSIFSISRYNDITNIYKSIFNPDFYSYRVSSPRKGGRRFFISTKKVDGTTFFNI